MSTNSTGLASPLWLVVVGAVALMFVATTYPTDDSQPAPAPPAPVPGAGIAYAPYVVQDSDTGCQYLSTHLSTGLVPRIAADGKTHMGCKGAAQ